ncbi:MAG: hypothetical protein M1132_10755 [Chloroflexi bacterium]|nr:hypothetical protein [Chloroflexota bacterium]
MSQFQLENAKGQSVVYGFDHAAGYFIQVHEPNGQVTVHRNSSMDGLTGSELVEVAEGNGVTLPDDHLLCAMLDLPIGEWNPLLVGH